MAEKRRSRGRGRELMLLILLLLLALILWWNSRDGGVRDTVGRSVDTASQGDTAIPEVASADTVRKEPAVDTVEKTLEKTVGRLPAPQDSDAGSGSADTETGERDSTVDSAGVTVADTITDPCARDTVAPWVYPDPSGGLHRQTVKLEFVADEACEITWKREREETWRRYDGQWIVIDTSGTIQYRAEDGCGNTMAEHAERYEIKRAPESKRCPKDMEFVSIGNTAFCVDHYEWPNSKDTRPSAFVSIYQAMDSCFAAGKRLCTADEWKLACTGPYGWPYPYGQIFERRACVTKDTTVAPSGSMPECRGYFEVFDMSGNLLEWTSTKSSVDSRFYRLMGGFWKSGQQSGCYHERYSYFPQNRHNPVGFRCCRDADKADR